MKLMKLPRMKKFFFTKLSGYCITERRVISMFTKRTAISLWKKDGSRIDQAERTLLLGFRSSFVIIPRCPSSSNRPCAFVRPIRVFELKQLMTVTQPTREFLRFHPLLRRYKWLETTFYLLIGFIPAIVVLTVVSAHVPHKIASFFLPTDDACMAGLL